MVSYKCLDELSKTKKYNVDKYFQPNESHELNCDCTIEQNMNGHKIPTKTTSFKNSTKTFNINTGIIPLQKIGLCLNTKVQLKPKKGFRLQDYISTALFCLLLGHGVFTYQELHCLKAEMKEVKNIVDILTDNLNMANLLYEQVQLKVTQLESKSLDLLKMKSEIHSVNKREVEPQMRCVECTVTNSPNNTTRHARSVTRGKHSHCKNRNGCRCRCYRTSGPLAIHLRGALPEITVRDGGIISPWYVDKPSSGVFLLVDGVIGESRGIVEIIEEGLYFIYAQLYYLTSSALNSYTINLQLGEDRSREDTVVAVCSAEAASSKLSELSCYTAVVRYLHRGDRIYVTQRERNRRIIFRDNKSFLGLTLLNSPQGNVQ